MAAMTNRVDQCVARWAKALGIDPAALPSPRFLRTHFDHGDDGGPCRPGAEPHRLDAWERSHGFRLPEGLRAWLLVSDGFYLEGPLIHPLTAIGPMIPFARLPDLVVQPESWFELGNPPTEPICLDLGYVWPGGDRPVFTSGDDGRQTRPRVIAPSFDAWFLRLLHEGGREYWFEPGFETLGDPWDEHRRRAPAPPLPARLQSLAPRVRPLMHPGADDRSIATSLGITRGDVETLFRHLQHALGP
jgi:hypothetical protein